MSPLTLAQLAGMAGGTLTQGAADTMLVALAIDSRAVPAGALFVAIKGEVFDGHKFVAAAATAGAAAVMVDASRAADALAVVPPACGVIVVDDTLAGLQRLAAAYRILMAPRVVAITGSNGKTSAKEFTAAVLGTRFALNATKGNLNNHIGLPLTMLAQERGQTHGVYELGMNHPGEIAALAALAKPDIAVITTMGGAHIEFFGSREAIAEEKASLFDALSPAGTAVVNLESPYAGLAMRRAPGKIVTTGINRGDVAASGLGFTARGHMSFTATHAGKAVAVELPVPGEHRVQNALLAIAVGIIEGVTLEEAARGLANGRMAGGRLQVKGWRGATIIDDSYNANPDSMKAALRTLAAQPSNARRIAVLGGMGELGAFSADGHAEVGRFAAELGLDVICAVGPAAEGIAHAAGESARYFPDHESCAAWLVGEIEIGDVVLVKGSRASAMENVLHAMEGASIP